MIDWQTIKDWCWWKFVIRENEFHPKLNINFDKVMKCKVTLEEEFKRIETLRYRAHKLDMKWGK